MTSLTYEDAEKIALQAIHDTDGRGMIGRGRNHLHQRVARALLSAARQARTQGPGEGSRATEALTWLSGRLELELSFGCVDGDPSEGAWIIHAVSGGVNDREWSEIAHGETVFEAIENARATYPAPPASQIKEG